MKITASLHWLKLIQPQEKLMKDQLHFSKKKKKKKKKKNKEEEEDKPKKRTFLIGGI